MTSPNAERFEGVSDSDLRRRLVEAGDRRHDARSSAVSDAARREQALLSAELVRRGVPLEEPRGRVADLAAAAPGGDAQRREDRPTLPPPPTRRPQPEERAVDATPRATGRGWGFD